MHPPRSRHCTQMRPVPVSRQLGRPRRIRRSKRWRLSREDARLPAWRYWLIAALWQVRDRTGVMDGGRMAELAVRIAHASSLSTASAGPANLPELVGTTADLGEVLAAADVLAVLLPLILATRALAGCCECAAVKSTAIG